MSILNCHSRSENKMARVRVAKGRVVSWLFEGGRGKERMRGGRRVVVGSERGKGVRPHAKKMEINVGSLPNFTSPFSLNIDSF